MTDYFVGTGGWAYFNVPGKSPLGAYSKIFNFVEVNYTFYQNPPARTVQKWRSTVPKDFTFSVRCHQQLTHHIGLKPTDEAFEVFYKAKNYGDILETPYLVMETPATYKADADARSFLSSLNLKGKQLIWEYRAPITPAVNQLMQDFNIVQSVDLSKTKPDFNSEVTYTRLFGKGQHNIYQYTNGELQDIQRIAEETGSKKVFMSFHGLRMNTDAIRFQQHLQTGRFLPATSATGLESAKSVLREDASFPSSKSDLIKSQGWKVIDVKENETEHLSKYLGAIPEKTYRNLEEVVSVLEATL